MNRLIKYIAHIIISLSCAGFIYWLSGDDTKMLIIMVYTSLVMFALDIIDKLDDLKNGQW